MKMNNKFFNMKFVYAVLFLLTGAISCNEGEEEDVLFTGDEYENIMQYIEGKREFESFTSIVKAGEMSDVLSAYNSNAGQGYTLFLPTNNAIELFIAESEQYSTLDELLKDVTFCAEIVRYHLVDGEIPSSDFPNGSLSDKTISNYYLTMSFNEVDGEVSFSVNNESKVLLTDIYKSNGVIHTIEIMLTPIVYTSYEWIEINSNYSIFLELLEKCGLKDTMNFFYLDELGRKIYNEYSLFAESNDLYSQNGIMSFSDLINNIDPESDINDDFTSLDNPVNMYARYHILEKSIFLDEFSSNVYNTYGSSPVSVDLEDGILKYNKGVAIFDSVVTAVDTSYVDYLEVILGQSNIVTRNGAIHQLNHMLNTYKPGRKSITYEFHEDPIINLLKDREGVYRIDEDTDLENISFSGVSYILYVKSESDIDRCSNNDYIQINGNFELTFKTPKVLEGRYSLKLVMERGYKYSPNIQAYIDDQKIGTVIDATVAIGHQENGFNINNNNAVGNVEFIDYTTHTIELRSIIPGSLKIDRIILQPVN